MNKPFLNSRISANNDKVEGHLANDEILIRGLKVYHKKSITKIKICTFTATAITHFL